MDQVLEPILALCEDLDSARSLSVAILARAGLWSAAQQLPPYSPYDFLDAETYMRFHFPGELLRKTELPGERERLHAKAVETFFALEKDNYRANRRLMRFLPAYLFLEAPGDVMIWEYFQVVRKNMRQLLGPLPKSLTPRFSTGATVGDVGKLTTIPDKISGRAQIYPSSTALLDLWWSTSWGRCSLNNAPRVVRSNVFFSVPKDSTKNRGCAKEASINVSYQLGAAQELRKALRKIGIDFEVGKDVHQALACQASRDETLCTIDLSNASDTLPKVLVKLLFPEQWYALLDSLRAKTTDVGGDVVYLEKFSSMGNGFTFELETLIFAVLARSLPGFDSGDTVSVFGDDIIVSKHLAEPLLAVLRFCGFTPNEKKTFLRGPFRESCGGDFWDGQPVRAGYLKEIPLEPHQLIAFANRIRSMRNRCKAITLRPWRKVLDLLPSDVRRCRGPESFGDLVIHDDESRWRFRVQKESGYQIRFFQTWSPIPTLLPWHHWRSDVQLACVTLCDSVGVGTRKAVSGYRLRWTQEPPDGPQWLPRV